MRDLLENIDRCLNKTEKQLKKLEPLIEEFERGLRQLSGPEQLRYRELAKSIENRTAAIRKLLS